MSIHFNLRCLLAIIFIVSSFNAFSQIHINEYSASNLHSFKDSYGKTEDWIELYNMSNGAFDVSGWHLSDKESKPMKWVIPDGTIIGPKEFLVFYCSGRDSIINNDYHTNFKLAQTSGKDIVLLSDPSGNVIESFEMELTLVEHSRCRSIDGGDEWVVCTNPSFESSNNDTEQFKAYTVAPSMDLAAGFYNGSQQVSIINNEANSELRYTLDGTNPTIDSPLYSGPITINQTTVVKAQSFSLDPGILSGKMDFNTYFIDEDFSLAVFSVAADEVQNLANGNGSLIPIGSLEYFNTNKEREATSFGSLNRHGQDSWVLDHRSIDWISRDEMGYSKAVNAPLFSYSDRDEYQKFMFRNSGDDNYPAIDDGNHEGSTHVRDEYVHTLAQLAGMSVDVRAVERVILFLNGEYWGVYGMRERPVDHDYTGYYYDQGKYDVQYLSTWGRTEIEYGGGKAQNDWVALRNYILLNDMSIPENYAIAEDSINMQSLIDYMLMNLNVVASDWLNYNTGWWRGLNPEGDHKKWGYILWDLDATFDYYINYSGVPNISPNAEPCDLEDIGNFMDSFFSGPPFLPSDPGPIANPEECDCLNDPNTPIGLDDPYFVQTIEEYNPCCDNWTGFCNWIYNTIAENEGVATDPTELNGNYDVGQHEKIFLKLLDESPEFQQLYYGRYADLMNTVFTCENMTTVLDSMIATIRPEMPRQIDRWGGSMQEWEDNVTRLRNFITERCESLDEGALNCYDELSGPYDITLMVEPNIGIGEIDFNTLDIEEFPWQGSYFGGNQNTIKARVFNDFEESYAFSHWISSAGNEITPSTLDRRANMLLTQNDTLTAVFVFIAIDEDGDGFTIDVDCDDSDPNINPEAAEICDNIDNNCDGQIDEGLSLTYYEDSDGDGFGNPEVSIQSCTGQVGFSLNNTDCDDTNAAINPSSPEVCDDIDNNCNGLINEGITQLYYADLDGDGYGDPDNSVEDCTIPAGYTLNNTDCDDNDFQINESAIEVPNNGIDENCDGEDEMIGTNDDEDGDGYISDVDCNDNDPNINPGATEICDGVDNNCDGLIDEGLLQVYYADNDGDGFGDPQNSELSCTEIPGYSLNNTDCDDTNADINPSSFEVCDNLDNNCDSQIDEGLPFETYYTDEDGDGFGSGAAFTSCIVPLDATSEGGDCDDSDPNINPGETEIPNNDIDEDCDGEALVIDNDGDGFNSDEDCDDSNPEINPAAEEIGGNGIDEDCDGVDGPSSLQQIDGLDVVIFPNPVGDKLFIETDHRALSFELYQANGQLIYSNKLTASIDVKSLPAGIYLMKVISVTNSEHFVHKLVKI